MYQLELTFEDKLTPEEYDRLNPAIWDKFVDFTMVLIRSGVKHYSSDGICHRIRFDTALSGSGQFKINNNMTSYYARKFHRVFPMYDGFFETRQTQKA